MRVLNAPRCGVKSFLLPRRDVHLHRGSVVRAANDKQAVEDRPRTQEAASAVSSVDDAQPLRDQVQVLPASFEKPSVQLVLLATLFALVAIDVNAPDSLHLLQAADTHVHTSVAATVSPEQRLFADKAISDTPIILAACISLACLTAVSWKRPKQGAAVLALFAFMNTLVGGVFFGMDARVTTALKRFFERARPTADLHHSFSFPSGHSTSVYFTAGFLFLIAIPCLNAVLASERQRSGDDTKNAAEAAVASIARPGVGLSLTVASGSVTQSGRLLADVHWLSDVVAGALLGSSGVVLSIMLLQALNERLGLAEDA